MRIYRVTNVLYINLSKIDIRMFQWQHGTIAQVGVEHKLLKIMQPDDIFHFPRNFINLLKLSAFIRSVDSLIL